MYFSIFFPVNSQKGCPSLGQGKGVGGWVEKPIYYLIFTHLFQVLLIQQIKLKFGVVTLLSEEMLIIRIPFHDLKKCLIQNEIEHLFTTFSYAISSHLQTGQSLRKDL